MNDPSQVDEAPATALPTPETSSNRPQADVAPVHQVGRYRILRELGRGGMGRVYLAHDPQVDRPVALKVPTFGPEHGEALERFYREARTAGRLQNPNICPVFDVGEADGVHYLCMAYIEGEPLSRHVNDYAQRPPRDAAALVHTLALALHEAHQKGIIHRDLKPANVMINQRGEPIVMDFGLAREVRSASALQTEQGVVFGTPAYMAPEQARGDVAAIGPGSDVYSLGVVLYELLVGDVPFGGPTMDVLIRHVRDEPPRPSLLRPDLDAHIEAICLKALAKEPSRRFLCMGEFAHALEKYTAGIVAGRPLAAPPEADAAQQAAAQAMLLLRTWGWEMGVEKLAARLASTPAAEGTPLALLLGWLQGQEAAGEGAHVVAAVRTCPALNGWALVGRAALCNRKHDFGQAEALLREAAECTRDQPRDSALEAVMAHQRGFWLYQVGRLGESLAALHQALEMCGREHYMTSQVLDTLGLVYANKNNFHAAREFFVQAIAGKRRFGDDRGIGRSLRQLGELYLDWDEPDRAEETLHQALELAQALQDDFGQAWAYRYLGRVTLTCAEREKESGRLPAARRLLARAGDWIDAGIRIHAAAGNKSWEGSGHRDRVLVCLAEDNLEQARYHADLAETLVRADGTASALARVRLAQGILARHEGHYPESEQLLRQALTHFDRTADYSAATRTQREIARTLAAAGALGPLVSKAYLDALRRAEACRRTALVRAIEEEFRGVDEEAHWRHIFDRTRGRFADSDTSSLTDGTSEPATVMFLNLKGFMPFCQGLEPEEVMQALNQLLADLGDILERAESQVTSYLGGGFMALVRGPGHAIRAVDAALELIAVVDEFNRPREVLGLTQLPVRIGLASGTVFLGNVGTYRKMDFTAVGNAVNLASRLVRHADDRSPCISRETHDLLGARFSFAADNPRLVDLPGLGRREVWDVTARKQGLSSQRPQGPA
jgi:class 3 adenylate cyclase